MSKKILIVEDEQALLRALKETFKEEGYEVYVAHNGEVGLENVQKYNPDLVLLDMKMPVMDGAQFITELQGRDIHTPVIVLTNNDEYNECNAEVLLKAKVSLKELKDFVSKKLSKTYDECD